MVWLSAILFFPVRHGAYPDGVLELSRINEAISIAAGEHSHKLIAPAADTPIAKNELAVLGGVTWQ
ncbi:phage tail protein [Citrobacter amalonaticus]|nr:phage tail protein [Citrobacter amalonaticus]